MALTTDDLLVRVTVDQTGAIKGFTSLAGAINTVTAKAAAAGKNSELAFKFLDAATKSVIETTLKLVSTMEIEGAAALKVAKAQADAHQSEISSLKTVIDLHEKLASVFDAVTGTIAKAAPMAASLFSSLVTTSTAGAAQVGLLDRALLSMKFNLENVSKLAGDFFSMLKTGAIAGYQALATMFASFGSVSALFSSVTAQMDKWGISFKAVGSIAGLTASRLIGLGVIMEGIGKAVFDLGKKMFDAFDAGIPAAIAMQDSVIKLDRAINQATYNNVKATSSLEEWQATIEQVREITDVYTTDLSAMAERLIKLGKTYDLTGAQQRELLSIMGTMIQAGNDQTQVLEAFTAALGGNNLELTKLGLTVNEEVLNNTRYAMVLGKTTVEMNAAQKAQAAFSAIHDQTAKSMDTVIVGELTHAEVLKRITNLQKDLDAQLANTSTSVTRIYAEAQLKVLEVLHLIPASAIDAYTSTVSYTGALLMGIGALTKYSVVLVAVVNGYKILQGLLAKNLAVQGAINGFFALLNGSIGTTYVSVTKLTDVFKNLGLTFIGIYGQAGTLVVSGLKSIGSAVGSLTLQLLKNPLLIQGAVIAASILVVYNLLAPFREEIQKLVAAMPLWLKLTLSVTAAIVALGVALKTSAVAQAGFIAGVRIFAAAVGAQVASIGTMSEAFVALRAAMLATATNAIPAIVGALTTATRAMVTFTLAVVTNPLFLAAAAIAGSITLVAVAFKELNNELPFVAESTNQLGQNVDQVSKKFTVFDAVLQGVKNFGLAILQKAVDAVKLVLISLIGVVTEVQIMWETWGTSLAASGDATDKTSARVAELKNHMAQLRAAGSATLVDLTSLGAGMSLAAKATGDLSGAIDQLSNDQKNAVVLKKTLEQHKKQADVAAQATHILGNEFEKVGAKAKESKDVFDYLFRSFDVDAVGAQEDLKAVTVAFDEMNKAALEVQKLQRDTLEKMVEGSQKVSIAEMRRSGNVIAAINAERDARLAAHDKEVANLAKLGKLAPEQHAIADEQRLAIIKESNAEIQVENMKRIEKAMRDQEAVLKDQQRIYDEISKTVAKLQEENAKFGATEYDLIRLKSDAELNDLKVMYDKLAVYGPLNAEAEKQLKLAEKLITANEQAGIEELVQKKVGEVKAQNLQIQLEILKAQGNEQDAADLQLQTQYEQLALQLQAAEAEGDVTAELQAQLELEMKRLGILDQRAKFEKELAKLSPEAQSVGHGIVDALPAINAGLVMAGNRFGIHIGQITEESALKYSLMAAKVFDTAQSVFGTLFEVAKGIFDPDTINGLADALDSIQKWPQQLLDAFSKLGTVMDSVIKSLPKAIESLVAQIPGIIGKLLDALPGLITVILNAIDKIIKSLPAIFQKIFDALPGIIAQIGKALPGIIKDLFSAIGDIISSLVQAIPGILNELFQHLPDIVEAIIEGLLSAMGKIVATLTDQLTNGGAEKIFASFIRMIPRLIIAIVVGVVKGLISQINSLLNGVHIKMPGGDIAANLQDSIKKIGQTAAGVSEQVFKVIDIGAAAKAKSVGDDIRAAVQSATEEMRNVSMGLWAALKALWQWVKDHIMDPIINALTAVWTQFVKPIADLLIGGLTNVWNNIVKPIIDSAIAGLKATWDLLSKVWTDTIKPIIDGMISGLSGVWATFKQISETLVSGLTTAWAALQKLWDTSVKPVVDALVGVAKDIAGAVGTGALSLKQGLVDGLDSIKTFFTQLLKGNVEAAFKSTIDYLTALPTTLTKGLKDKFVGLTQDLKDLGGKMAEGAMSGLTSAAQTFKDLGSKFFEGLSKAFNDNAQFFRDFGGKIWEGLQKGLSSVTGGGGGGGLGGILKAAGFAMGGMIAPTYAASGMYVMAPKGIDTVPIMAAADESILNRRATANIGGKPTIDALNAGQPLVQRQQQPTQQNVEQHFEINVKVDGSKAVNEKDLAEKIIAKIKADSYAGVHIMSTKGLRS